MPDQPSSDSSETSGFEYACFISYKHPPSFDDAPSTKHFYDEFVEAFEKILRKYLTVQLGTYRDDKLKSQPGIDYPQELAERLCKSVCMVAILVPEYQESSWCVAEWSAMELLESKRIGKKGLIIPILFRGDAATASTFVGPRQMVDLHNVSVPSRQLDNVGNRRKIEAIAERISRYARKLTHTGVTCKNFKIIAGKEEMTPIAGDPDPFK